MAVQSPNCQLEFNFTDCFCTACLSRSSREEANYLPQRRRMERVTLKGDAVQGARDAMADLVSANDRTNLKPEARQQADIERYQATSYVFRASNPGSRVLN